MERGLGEESKEEKEGVNEIAGATGFRVDRDPRVGTPEREGRGCRLDKFGKSG